MYNYVGGGKGGQIGGGGKADVQGANVKIPSNTHSTPHLLH